MRSARAEPAPRPVVGAYTMALAPYEVHFYRRIAGELPCRLVTLLAYEDRDRAWDFGDTETIGLRDISSGDRQASMLGVRAQLREWKRGLAAIRVLREEGARALILAGYNDLGRLRAAWWCRRNGIPVFLATDSNFADERGKSRLKLLLKRAYLRLVRALVPFVFAVGPLGVEYWRHYGFAEDRIFVRPYEPDYALIDAISDDDVRAAASRYGIDPRRRRIVFSGRFAPVKRVDLLIEAFKRVADERPEWDLLLVGDGELRAELESRVPEGLRDRVIWTGFLAEQREVSLLYKASDLLALPSEREPWAVVVNEAVAAGLALVTSDGVGASAALLKPGVNGEFFPRGDLDGLTVALRRATAPGSIDRYRAASAEVLAEWRRVADPIDAVHAALRASGVLP